ncbi:hypothetical protein RvY_13938-1 [Ramazzottius varieornatus]|uniref:Uncharacterized protein n=1 Tax=Ramazzottius varieornatus TaxID=947166 RepID=A0A1D1VRD4_RAMVA|nr:hypothetical protein RvY_13938-1 [Ramazzottius varieornatus]
MDEELLQEETEESLERKMQEIMSCLESYNMENEESDEECEVDPLTIKDIAERFLYAAEKNHLDLVRSLLDENPSLLHASDSDGYTALHRASYNDHAEMAAELIFRHASVRARTNDGWEPLHSAARWNCPATAKILLHNGADVNAVTNNGLTALHLAASNRQAGDMILCLLSHPCIDVSLKSAAGETALIIARRSGPYSKYFDSVPETGDCFTRQPNI